MSATAEQKEKAEARRLKFRALAKQLSALPAHERAALAARLPVIATIEGRTLSPFNMCLIAAQYPSASIVGGFRQWLKAGRVVRKGESGLSLWCPAGKRKESASAPADASDNDSPRFIAGCVFDVSQTEELQAEAVAA